MGNIDTDAARRARAEVTGERHTWTVNGETLELPVELPYTFAEHLVERDFRSAITDLVGKEKAGELLASGLTTADIYEFCDQIAKLYAGSGSRGES